MTKHLIFFDHTCKLCQNAVLSIKKGDTQGIFEFFPLTSMKAKELLPPNLLKGDTLVLLENGSKIWVRSNAVFRILKLLGGKWSFLGFLAYVPGLDIFYRVVAHNRHFFD